MHIEVAHFLSTDSFLNAFNRFVALRGSVREIRYDQGTNLVGARNELLKMGCDMVFNPPQRWSVGEDDRHCERDH